MSNFRPGLVDYVLFDGMRVEKVVCVALVNHFLVDSCHVVAFQHRALSGAPLCSPATLSIAKGCSREHMARGAMQRLLRLMSDLW